MISLHEMMRPIFHARTQERQRNHEEMMPNRNELFVFNRLNQLPLLIEFIASRQGRSNNQRLSKK